MSWPLCSSFGPFAFIYNYWVFINEPTGEVNVFLLSCRCGGFHLGWVEPTSPMDLNSSREVALHARRRISLNPFFIVRSRRFVVRGGVPGLPWVGLPTSTAVVQFVFRRLLMLSTSLDRGAQLNAPLLGWPCPLHVTIFHAAIDTIDRIESERMRHIHSRYACFSKECYPPRNHHYTKQG